MVFEVALGVESVAALVQVAFVSVGVELPRTPSLIPVGIELPRTSSLIPTVRSFTTMSWTRAENVSFPPFPPEQTGHGFGRQWRNPFTIQY
jgi:hypothetical protein